MPPIVRKLLVVAAVDGILLSPYKQQKPTPPVQIKYATREITGAPGKESKGAVSLEAHGIVGLLTLASTSYLIAISSRRQVAQIKGRAIYVVTGVTLIPLSSQAEAKQAIEQSKQSLKAKASSSDPTSNNSDTSDEETERHNDFAPEEDDDVASLSSPEDKEDPTVSSRPRRNSTIAQDVIGRKGQYGRFAARWFSKKGWTVDKRRMQGMSVGENDSSKEPEPTSTKTVEMNEQQTASKSSKEEVDVAVTLLPKLLRTTKLLLGSCSFYFSYDYDVTRRLGSESTANTEIPLHKIVDPLYFWNRSLSAPFVDAGQHAYVLPLMQGFIGQKAFTVNTEANDSNTSIAAVAEDPGDVIEMQENSSKATSFKSPAKTKDYLITLLSRRSVLRPGLRYLRRGIDDDGHVANAVETEQLLSDPSWSPSFSTYSFTQIRGSIPLFFSQSPMSLKPAPVLQHSFEVNHAAFSRHFADLKDRYGEVEAAVLVDKHGVEAKIGEEYEEHTKKFNEGMIDKASTIGFEWFDFHKICAGMKFENVSILMGTLEPVLSSYGMTIEKDCKIQRSQTGVLRTNCMDCLDRTNVVQSATGQRALEVQLAMDGIKIDLQADMSTQWFNSLWADNGDAISKQYSSTAALKGDYTRTRKRDYRGAINDLGLTLSRYYNNIVNDYFSQIVIDYLLGNVTDRVFEEFESSMMSVDPGVSMKKVRQNAIDTSAKIVIGDQSEELSGGWTVSTPHETNTLRSLPFEEIVLLVTDAALYAVRFDWNTEKVSSFERIDLRSIVGARRGIYITSTLTAAQTDPTRNVGLVITYKPYKQNLARVNTRSMSTVGGLSSSPDIEADEDRPFPEGTLATVGEAATDVAATSKQMQQSGSKSSTTVNPQGKSDLRLLALKALPAHSSAANGTRDAGDGLSESQLLADICAHVAAAVGGEEEWGVVVEEEDIIGLTEAKKSTGLVEWWGHNLKKLVWA